MKRVLCVSLLSLLAFGCYQRVGDFALASTKNLGTSFTIVQPRVRGKDCAYLLFLSIPLGSLRPNIEEAIDRAMQDGGDGDILVNASLSADIYITPVISQQCIRVEGDLAKSTAPKAAP
ncbi:MAG: hypothetical protein N3C12_00820 [Candidatus Binatia bacterium]|nr:hypothetical protein [Candidatus Binatia bacterium]